MLLDVLWDCNYKGKMAIFEEFIWHCTRLSTDRADTAGDLYSLPTMARKGRILPGYYKLPLLWRNQGADRDPTDISPPMNQKSYPTNNDQKWLYISLIKSGSVFTIFISNTDAVSYHPFCSSAPVPAGAWLRYPQLQWEPEIHPCAQLTTILEHLLSMLQLALLLARLEQIPSEAEDLISLFLLGDHKVC